MKQYFKTISRGFCSGLLKNIFSPSIVWVLVMAGTLLQGEASTNVLDIKTAAEHVDLRAWPLGSDETFQLQSNTNLSSESWVDVGEAVMGRNQSWQNIVAADQGHSFFRLIRKNPPEARFALDGSLNDGSSHARNLSVSSGGTAGWSTGRTGFDQAYLLDGANTLNFTGPGETETLSLSMHVYLEDLQGATPTLFDSGTGNGNIQLYLRDSQNGTYTGIGRDVGLVFKVGGNTGGNGRVDGSVETRYRRIGEHSVDFIDDTGHERRKNQLWLHFAVTYDPASHRADFYINGKHDSTQYFTSSEKPVINSARIGAKLSGADPLIARISNVNLYSSILSENTLRALGDFRQDLWAVRDIDDWDTVRTFHVASTGDDGNDGSEGQPFKTLKAAIQAVNNLGNTLAPGSRIVMEPGLYREEGVILERSGTRFQPIVIEARIPGTVTLSGSEVWDDDAWIQQTVPPEYGEEQPGLLYGEVPGNINTSDPNPNSGITTDLSETEDGISPYTTEIYTGEIYDADGNISFTEDIDDMTRLYIDGVLVLSSDDWWDRTSTGNLNLQPGWHTFELRISNAGGGSGPNSLPGFGYDPDGGTAWIHPEDPGDGSLFRCDGTLIPDSGSIWTHAWPYDFGRSTTETVNHDTEVQFRREILVLDGEMARPYTLLSHLEAGSDPRPGESDARGHPHITDEHAFMVDEATDTIYLRTTKNPNTALVEIGITEEILYSRHENFIVVRGLKFQHAASFPPYKAALDLGRGSYLLVEDCEFSDNGSEGLLIQHGTHNGVVRRSEGHRNGRNGFKFSQGCSNMLVEDCITTNNLWRVDVGNYTGADLAGFAKIGRASRVYFDRVHIAHHNRIGLWADIQNWDITVNNCYLRDNRSCLWFEIGTLNQELINSALYDNVNSSVHFSGENVRVINNMVQQKRTSGAWGLFTTLGYTSRDEQPHMGPIYMAKDAVIRNNMVSSFGAASGRLIGFNTRDSQLVADTITSDNNTYYAPYAHSTQTPHFGTVAGNGSYMSIDELNTFYNDSTSTLLPVNSPPFVNQGQVTVEFDGTWATARESRMVLQVPVTVSEPVDDTITVNLTTEEGTAQEGIDFRVLGSRSITFHPLQRRQVINILLLRDDIPEGSESFKLHLTTPSNAALGTNSTYVVDIQDR
ncbi:Calx-beta domain-containing protein [Pontiellaceae bacterium B12227]|nr:Calx-beta domain-containing protein [Pontiellaceae bacterium B12227]